MGQNFERERMGEGENMRTETAEWRQEKGMSSWLTQMKKDR